MAKCVKCREFTDFLSINLTPFVFFSQTFLDFNLAFGARARRSAEEASSIAT